MADPRHALAIAAESAVATWLAGTGWTIVARRRRSRSGGEVDIVALDPARILVAVEVRARRSVRAGRAAETVDRRRIGRLARTLSEVAADTRPGHRGLRIDLVSVEPVDPTCTRWRLRRLAGVGEA